MSAEIIRTFIFSVAAFLGFMGVAAGAMGAHMLKESLTPYELDVYKTAVQYQMWHVFALLATPFIGGAWTLWIAIAFLLGIILFSGSLYLLIFFKNKVLGIVTPIGGLCFLAGWLLLLVGAWQNR